MYDQLPAPETTDIDLDIDALRLAIQLARNGPPEFWRGRVVICRKPAIKAILGYLLEIHAI